MRPIPAGLRRRIRSFGRPTGRDVGAGLVTGLFSIPEGMAYAGIAGFNPVQGIYAGMAATVFGSMFARTVLMVTTLTSAIALTSQSVLAEAGLESTDPAQLATLVVLTGLVMIVLGVLRLGVVMSFVSNAVMTGFSVGIAVQIITGALGDATGYDPEPHNKLAQLWDWLVHIGDWKWPIVGTALGTVVIWTAVRWFRRLRSLAILVAMLTATLAVTVAEPSVPLAGDMAAIPGGLPAPVWPDWSVAPELLGGAVAVALVALAQAAGIGVAVPNPDGRRADVNRDFIAQGLANLAGGFTRALPTGGSLSRTGVSVAAGARTRWAGVFAGLWLTAIVVTVGHYAEFIPMAVIGGLILVIGVELVAGRVGDIRLVVRTSGLSTLAMLVTFLATTQLPLQQAIILGGVLSLLLYCAQAARQSRLRALTRLPGGGWRAAPVPAAISSGTITVLEYDGLSFFAELPRMDRQWPDVTDARDAVIILRLRGLPDVPSSALVKLLTRWSVQLARRDCRLILAGVDTELRRVLARSGAVAQIGSDNLVPPDPVLGRTLELAWRRAESWLTERTGTADGSSTKDVT